MEREGKARPDSEACPWPVTPPSWVGPTPTTPPRRMASGRKAARASSPAGGPRGAEGGGPDSLEPGAGRADRLRGPGVALAGAGEVALSFPLARPFLAHPAGCCSSRGRQSRGESKVGEQEGGTCRRRDPSQPGFFSLPWCGGSGT